MVGMVGSRIFLYFLSKCRRTRRSCRSWRSSAGTFRTRVGKVGGCCVGGEVEGAVFGGYAEVIVVVWLFAYEAELYGEEV